MVTIHGGTSMHSKKVKLATIDIAKKYLSGIYTFEEFVAKFINDKKVYNYAKKYAEKKLYYRFPEIEVFKNIENTYWTRHHYYNLMYSYLFTLNIQVDSYCDEFSIYRKLDNILPEWFQLDLVLLYEMFPNLDELIEGNKLTSELKNLCKCQEGVFPIWLQSPEWPVHDKVPLTFIKQTWNPNNHDYEGQEIEYYFLDENNNKQIIIVQID